MLGTDYLMVQGYHDSYPNSHVAMTKVVAAAAKLAKNIGKKSFFGSDKQAAAQKELNACLENLKAAWQLDSELHFFGTIGEDDWDKLNYHLSIFRKAYQNWQDAYAILDNIIKLKGGVKFDRY
jgi:hypothetical protein